MGSSGKFDISSRPLYTSGKRGSYTTASMERSASFRDNVENPILSSLPSMSRSTMNVSQGDVNIFFQCLRFDLKSMATEYKCNRHGDFKRLANNAFCTNAAPEDVKRLKVGLRESTIKARERVKIFSEVLSVINKCFPSIPSRKRSRPDAFSGDRSNGVLVDRTTVGKMGTQNHALTSAFDVEPLKVEERGKNVIPSKRTRTSMVDQRADVRPNTPARSSGSVDRDREVLRIPNNNTLQSVDRTLPPIATGGWEKAKMKKKRTGIKADTAPSTSTMLAKPIDGIREPKQGMHPRSLSDSRSRLNDSLEFRLGAANGGIGAGKANVISQRFSVARPEQENTSIFNDKRDQTTNLEQEWTKVRALNKATVREDFISSTPSSTAKLHTSARGPRSGSNIVPKLSNIQRATVSNGLESRHSTSKNPNAINSTNRKRSLSARSSSPPVTQWADRRPQKISRAARRTNLVPVVSTNNEPDFGNSDVTVTEKGRGFVKRFPVNNSPKQFKAKGDRFQSSMLSETEESRVTEIRFRDNNSKSGRGFASVLSVGNGGIAKQLRTSRVGFDKPESKIGRPPTRKLADRRGCILQKHSVVSATADFIDDGHGELLAAANAVINPDSALSSPFWRHMDPLFNFVSDANMTYIKQEESIQSTYNTANPIESCDGLPNGITSVKPPKNRTEKGSEWSESLTSETSLCQRLLAALISEEDNDDELNYNVYGSAFENSEFGGSFSSSYRIDSTLRSCNEMGYGQSDDHVMSMSDSAIANGFDNCYNGLLSDPAMMANVTSSRFQYGNMTSDERLLVEIQSLGLYPERVPDLVHTGDEDVNKDISRLEAKLHQQVSKKKSLLNKLLKSTEKARELHEKEFEQLSLEKLTGMAYQKYVSSWGLGKNASGKMAKQAAKDFVKRTLDRCHEFELTGKSCFWEPLFKEMFRSGLSRLNDAEVDGVIDGTQLSPLLNNNDLCLSEQTTGKDYVWSSIRKKTELYLDDVACTSSGIPTGVGMSIINSVKGKRSERDREGKMNGSKNGCPKFKGERKTKAKLKQKTINGSLGKFPDQQRAISSPVPKSIVNEDEEPLDLSHLQLPGMDDFGVGDDFGGQGEDIGSWLNIDDDVFQQDDDFMGLEIPMDDLTDLNMMV